MRSNEIVAGADYVNGGVVRRVLSIEGQEIERVKQMPDGSLKKATQADLKKWDKASGDINTARVYRDRAKIEELQAGLGFLAVKERRFGGVVAYREDGNDAEMPRDEFAEWAERRKR